MLRHLPRYTSPMAQILLLGIICFACPGMFNALNGMGAGGRMSDSTASAANTALYALFAIASFPAGAIYNVLGGRMTLFVGALGYILYVGAFLAYNHVDVPGFVMVAGGVLGVCAALLWTAQGGMMMSYPSQREKGRAIGMFWIVFNLGGVLGGLIPLFMNWDGESAGGVNDGTYIGFMVVMGLGALVSMVMLPPNRVIRDDGTKIEMNTAPRMVWWKEMWNVLGLFRSPTLLLLTPLFLASNWFYSYQFNGVNAMLFNVRTRGFNNVIYWGAQMLGAWILGRVLDVGVYGMLQTRRSRARGTLATVMLLFSAAWAGGLVLQLTYTRTSLPFHYDFIRDAALVAGPITLYALYGLLDAMLQTWCYWIMSSDASLSPESLALRAGFYKGMQSIGGAIAWGVDAGGVEFWIQLVICWGLLVLGTPGAWIVAGWVKEDDGEGEMMEHDVDKEDKEAKDGMVDIPV